MNVFGIVLIIAVAIGLLLWKKCGGSCGIKKKDEQQGPSEKDQPK